MKVYLNDNVHPAGREKLKARGAEIVDNFDKPEEIDGMIVRGVVATREILEKLPNLKVVGKHGAGYNTIDVDAAHELGVRVVYTPGQNAQGVAELIVALMLDASRSVSRCHSAIKTGEFDEKQKTCMTSMELSGKTVALIGMGNVSRKAAKILQYGFDMKVIGYDAFVPEGEFQKLGIQRYECLEEMLSVADYVSISVPLTDETRNMIGEKQFKCMKPSAILVNTSRGGIVNEDDLYVALKNGTIAAAGSDVFVQEPPTNQIKLFELPNFVGTPHIGGNTQESIYRCTDTVVEEVLAVLEGNEPRFEVK